MRFSSLAATILLSALACGSARAAIIDFTLTGSRNASFAIDTSTPPSSVNVTPFGDQIFYDKVAGIYGGVPGLADIDFGEGPILADFQISGTPLGFTQFGGPTLFSGALDDPSFTIGQFDLTSLVSGRSVLTIAEAAAVPEPAGWLLCLGFAVAGGFTCARSRRAAAG
jgi:hypothetical protein